MSGPNPVAAAWSMLRARRVRRPRPGGTGSVDHAGLGPVLEAIAEGGLRTVDERSLADYLVMLQVVEPDRLSPAEALAYWLNLYNAAALDLATRAARGGMVSVLDVAGGFTRPAVTVTGEALSLDGIEHGKIRRFGDPRIHAALVCGSLSCPTLRFEPFVGDRLDLQLDEQMRRFLASGGIIALPAERRVLLSRVLLWVGADFVRPHRMPAFLPATRRSVVEALTPWMSIEVREWLEQTNPSVRFQEYDWGLACAVAPSGMSSKRFDKEVTEEELA